MSSTAPAPIVNLLLARLPHTERKRILQHCEPVQMLFGSVLCEADQPLRSLYFPLTGFISLVTTLEGHQPLELGLIGNEGMLGATLALDIASAPTHAVVQGTGSALRISARRLRQALPDCPRLLRALKRYLYVLMVQLAQNAACSHFHELEPRLARWLLMTHDRAHADNLHLTHEFLADMLGVRRSGVTIAAGTLQQRRLIRYSRGEITILDRQGLKAVACECYDALIEDYARLFPVHGNPLAH
ncbi:Crp/Fnr family transcriptional regulator [Stutzerimonas kirkiae]|uniref:Crp/Fnr family transcriptional regulator n=1 Tax=Stutzerimonas kirkiae TaxID=2211392 RepID=A0A4Q9R062_9GAMM|nr:Crp/Fnr family transcriptional regulator [Stutzerimonas kirkiae]TBU92021.1 Crp/Fnr family transcriptional regulator [Stutzerimonas kirkiae]TBU98439.1 Crp/Fnr family transcriptional regulator [Stutzerimonas kirkiae]TBV05582.1 Crp/Fnr family transcriptional regulator [Stutzerimonas kirkiae]TBV10678.1 Crp/Fnr family transcriptional regulator [Stutzerimonas kirkiae]